MLGTISATDPDWSRERGNRLLKSIRDYQRGSRLAVLRHRFWSSIKGTDIPLNSRIGGGLLTPHPQGIVIHPDSEIGPNCLLFQQVTIGANDRGVPRLGGHVDVGAGAKIIGPVTIGNHARIGANAVVVCDVPDGATAVGIPARIIKGEKTVATAALEPIDDQISLLKASAWADAQGSLNKLAELAGQGRGSSRHTEQRYETIRKRIADFIADFEADGLEE